MQLSLSDSLDAELHRVENVNRNRQTLKHFIDLAVIQSPGRPGYVYAYQNRGRKAADEESVKALERLERACKRAEVSYEAICQEHHLTVH